MEVWRTTGCRHFLRGSSGTTGSSSTRTRTRIRMSRPWMPIRIRQNDANLTGFVSGSARLTRYLAESDVDVSAVPLAAARVASALEQHNSALHPPSGKNQIHPGIITHQCCGFLNISFGSGFADKLS
jgi:hypothetical protein